MAPTTAVLCGMKDCDNTLRPGETSVCALCLGKLDLKNASTSKRPMSDKVAAVGAYAAEYRNNNDDNSTGSRRYAQHLQQVSTFQERRKQIGNFVGKKRTLGHVPQAKPPPFANAADLSHKSHCHVTVGFRISYNDTIVSPWPQKRHMVEVDTEDQSLEYSLVTKASAAWPPHISSESEFADWPTPKKPFDFPHYYYIAKMSGPITRPEYITYPEDQVNTCLAGDIQRFKPTAKNQHFKLELIYNADKWFEDNPEEDRPENLPSTKPRSPSKGSSRAPPRTGKGKRKARDSVTPTEAALDDDPQPSAKRTKTSVPATPQMLSDMLPPPPPLPKRRPRQKKNNSSEIQIVSGPSSTPKTTVVVSNGFDRPDSPTDKNLETIVVPGTLHREFN